MKKISAVAMVLSGVLLGAGSCEARPVYNAEVTGTGHAQIKLTVDGKVVVDDQRAIPFSYPVKKNAVDVQLSAISVEGNKIVCLIIGEENGESKIMHQNVGTEVNCWVP